ncbi:MAG: hypothetical protein ACR2RA_26820 [Geminicoccaceae bacterium]
MKETSEVMTSIIPGMTNGDRRKFCADMACLRVVENGWSTNQKDAGAAFKQVQHPAAESWDLTPDAKIWRIKTSSSLSLSEQEKEARPTEAGRWPRCPVDRLSADFQDPIDFSGGIRQ